MADFSDDIIKYKRGELSAQEMHALEKRALTDPFLADALEGIDSISHEELSADVAELHQKISKTKKNSNVLIWRIAAGIALSAALIFAVYQFKPTPETLALKTEKTTAQPQPPADEAEKNINNKAEASPSGSVKKELPAPKKPADKVPPEKSTAPTPIVALSKEKNTEPLNGGAKKDKLLSGDVIASTPPIPEADLTMPKENVTVASPLAIGAEKEMSRAISKKGRMENTASPEGGFEAFERYLESNLRFPEKALENNIAGVVIIELTITPDGRPGHLKVIKSLGYGCDEEAVRLVKEGPNWITASGNDQPTENTVQVQIKFNRPKPNK